MPTCGNFNWTVKEFNEKLKGSGTSVGSLKIAVIVFLGMVTTVLS